MKRKNKKTKKKIKKKTQKKALKKKRSKTNSRQNKRPIAPNLQKVIDFKFRKIFKVYDDFQKKRKIEKSKQDKLKDKGREEQIKEEKKGLKEEEINFLSPTSFL